MSRRPAYQYDSRLGWPLVAILGFMLLVSGVARADRLELRDGAPELTGRAVVVDASGVQFRSRGAKTRFFTWDRVRFLETESATLSDAFQANRVNAETLWRARARLARGDATLAEPLFESLFDEMKGRTDATALVAVEGLLRCRLARGARASAVIPWLETVRLIKAGVQRTAYTELPAVIDSETGLCPSLAPVWVASLATTKLVDDLAQYVPVDAPEVELLSKWYFVAAARTIGAPPPWPDDEIRATNGSGMKLTQGISLVSAFCRAVHDRGQLTEAEARVFARFTRESKAVAAWAHYGRGHALLNAASDDDTLRGLLELLTVPGIFADEAPFLAGLALRDAARELSEMGRDDAAESLERELTLHFPHHPINRAAEKTARSTGA